MWPDIDFHYPNSSFKLIEDNSKFFSLSACNQILISIIRILVSNWLKLLKIKSSKGIRSNGLVDLLRHYITTVVKYSLMIKSGQSMFSKSLRTAINIKLKKPDVNAQKTYVSESKNFTSTSRNAFVGRWNGGCFASAIQLMYLKHVPSS